MKITTIGLDLGKRSISDSRGEYARKAVLRRQLRRSEMARFFANLDPRA